MGIAVARSVSCAPLIRTRFYLQGFSIVLGAELNAETEHRTALDTTRGPPAPMGERGAYVADTPGSRPR